MENPKSLIDFEFNQESKPHNDYAYSPCGWIINEGEEVDAGTGNDVIIGESDVVGISNSGVLKTAEGNDKILGKGDSLGIYGVSFDIGVPSSIQTGPGNDCVTGSGTTYGIWLYGYSSILTGPGNDKVQGQGGLAGIFIFFGQIDTAEGNDDVIGEGSFAGIFNSSGAIETAEGNDNIIGTSDNIGIANLGGTINTGIGNDTICGSGDSAGIFNEGVIETDAGNDIVKALVGGFSGIGTTNLGPGKDTLIGFGTGQFNGGDGTDTILLGEGSYSVVYDMTTETGTIQSGGTIMNIESFEAIGGVDGQTVGLVSGLFEVNNQGVGGYS